MHQCQPTKRRERDLRSLRILQTVAPFLQATVWNDSSDNGLTVEHQFKLSNTVVSISCHSHFVAMGSTSVQLTNVDNFEWRRTVADDSHEDESLEVSRVVRIEKKQLLKM